MSPFPHLYPSRSAKLIISNRSRRIRGSPPETLIMISKDHTSLLFQQKTEQISSFVSSFSVLRSPHRLPQNSQKALHFKVASQNKTLRGYCLSLILLFPPCFKKSSFSHIQSSISSGPPTGSSIQEGTIPSTSRADGHP